ncbi:MAG: hypothetical protein US30_C0012G0033 [Candidatus Moranbacteria bacterium GW2011_GWF2_36_839]|nr:MAG: hypothetical protein US27_C0012G0007 [Candidatus Moranbacteria bacterium GW2011_GWF1_36_78]KKQ16723.1 MAG: hypothetical protein US30_C0012G0033 [Candidatus Moranbacteria bacterium GW2011_GWF2_36_839]HAT74236.1 hypothetical protein [Candidatus Moranbacteria bacterium]HBY11396.1 hypothetical protein [Candidatus Moranbacteria bacterium]
MYFRFSALNTGSNFFNDNLRYKLARYPMMRQALGLHFDGDAKADYLGGRYKNIIIKIVAMNGLEISDETARIFAKKVEEITGKKTSYLFRPSIKYEALIGMGDLKKELEKNNSSLSSQGAVIYVFIASQKKDDSVNLGSTLLENGIVLFKNPLSESMRNNTPEALDVHSASLLLHEFGHQIGLAHNATPGCLMNAQTEFSDEGRLLEKINDFYPDEKNQIKKTIL